MTPQQTSVLILLGFKAIWTMGVMGAVRELLRKVEALLGKPQELVKQSIDRRREWSASPGGLLEVTIAARDSAAVAPSVDS